MSTCLKFGLHLKVSMTQDFVLGLRLLWKHCSASSHVVRLRYDLEQIDNLLLKQHWCNCLIYQGLLFNFHEVLICFNRCYVMLITSYSKMGILFALMLLERLQATTCCRASYPFSYPFVFFIPCTSTLLLYKCLFFCKECIKFRK